MKSSKLPEVKRLHRRMMIINERERMRNIHITRRSWHGGASEVHSSKRQNARYARQLSRGQLQMAGVDEVNRRMARLRTRTVLHGTWNL